MQCGTLFAIALVALAAGGVARADVKAGVDAWTQGDYATAIAEWRPLAEAGDADAQFNLGQAYKLGRGVPMDLTEAAAWYRRATLQGHVRAEDNYGLLLFQQTHRTEAMPYLQRSAARGEPRAQYLVGIALFNGDLLPRDWVMAYAMTSRAAAAGLPQATGALAQMDTYLSDDQRRQGVATAQAIAAKAELLAQQGSVAPEPPPPVQQRPAPTPLRAKALPPSASATYPSAATASTAAKPLPVSATPVEGGWRIQLGAFSTQARAEAQWKSASKKVGALSNYRPLYVPGDTVIRLQTGPLGSRAEAAALCAKTRAADVDCLVKAP